MALQQQIFILAKPISKSASAPKPHCIRIGGTGELDALSLLGGHNAASGKPLIVIRQRIFPRFPQAESRYSPSLASLANNENTVGFNRDRCDVVVL